MLVRKKIELGPWPMVAHLLSPACASRVVRDVRGRGREPCWSTSPENIGSIRVAEKLGARKVRDDVLYRIGPELE